MDELPTDYDAIVVGTGMTESVIAAALSRIGKSVLHIDPNEYYGGNWASFNLRDFENWIKSIDITTDSSVANNNYQELLQTNEEVIKVTLKSNIYNVKQTSIFENQECENEKDEKEPEIVESTEVNLDKQENRSSSEFQTEIKKLSKKFSIDLCPKLLFSRGTLVQLLITSNIARYAEFKSVSRILTWRDNQLEPVPCSRADVFATQNVSVVQKRILVKILTLFANYEQNLHEFEGFENKTFLDYLKHKKLPENLIHYILYAIAMGDNTTLCLKGVKACKVFLESLGKYGNTPFIFPMYGSGELPQSFCRLCAVFGGIYCLNRGIEGLVISDKKCVGVISNNQLLNAKTVILSYNCAPESFFSMKNITNISRGVFITDRSILNGDKSITLLQFPPVSQVSDNSITILELGSGTFTCPENFYVVHMITKTTKDASSDFQHVIKALFEVEEEECSNKPKILWSTMWNVATGNLELSESCCENVKICSSVDSEFDYESSIKEAKRIFNELNPDEEFLPRAPDPEEIVLGTEETEENSTNISDKAETLDVGTEKEKETEMDIGADVNKTESNS